MLIWCSTNNCITFGVFEVSVVLLRDTAAQTKVMRLVQKFLGEGPRSVLGIGAHYVGPYLKT